MIQATKKQHIQFLFNKQIYVSYLKMHKKRAIRLRIALNNSV